jgi:hypothetical protein
MKMNTCWIVKIEATATNNECMSSMPMLTIVVVMDPEMVKALMAQMDMYLKVLMLKTMEVKRPSMVTVVGSNMDPMAKM